MRMISADDLEQALREAGLAEVIKDDCSKCTSAWGVPIVDAEPVKHGHWIDRAQSILGVPTEACSECAEWSIGFDKDYCPNCGAKMDEVEEHLTMPKADGSTIPKSYMNEVTE